MSDKLKEVINKQQRQQQAPEEHHTEDIVQLVGFIIGEEEYAVASIIGILSASRCSNMRLKRSHVVSLSGIIKLPSQKACLLSP